MNDNFQMFSPLTPKNSCKCESEMRNVATQINILHQEIRRLERRIFNIEKSLINAPLNELNPSPMEYNNLNYTNDNYII